MSFRRELHESVRWLFRAGDSLGFRIALGVLAMVSVLGAWEIIASGLWRNEFETEVQRARANDVFGRYESDSEARAAVRARGNPYSLFW